MKASLGFVYPLFLFLSTLYSLSVSADDNATLSALKLADNTAFDATKYPSLNVFAESAISASQYQKHPTQRISLDTRWDSPVLPQFFRHWRFMVSHRFDQYFSHRMHHNCSVSSLREAYVSVQPTPQMLLNFGRINTRYGVAFSYNPTDFLGQGTTRKVDSGDPDVRRFNRLGNAMLQLQHLWARASVTTMISPSLKHYSGNSRTGFNWQASNPANRLLVVASYQMTENFNPQVLFFQEQHQSPQVGLNMSAVLSRSTLAYLEAAGGKQTAAWEHIVPGSSQARTWRNRIALGATWTGDSHQTLRIEGYYNEAADSRRVRRTLSSLPYYAFRGKKSGQHLTDGMTSRRGGLAQIFWKDIVDQYDVNLLWQHDLQQHLNTGFMELRRHLGPVDIAVQWQKTIEMKNYVTRPDQIWRLSANYYF